MTYTCIACQRSNIEPLQTRVCSICGQYCCSLCLPDHEMRCAKDLEILESMTGTPRDLLRNGVGPGWDAARRWVDGPWPIPRG